ncbi:hypothetical protein [Petrachloros mirabilis]
MVIPLAAKYHAAVIGVVSNERGIPAAPEERLAVAIKIVRRAADYGIPAADIIIGSLALPVCVDSYAGKVALDMIRLVRQALGVNLSLGASNITFGLPDHKAINAAYLALVIARGLTVAITDPTINE